ncbi:PAS domain S-box protein [Roseomonas sp. SSH11]|uniref:histidine kinase n=1 Tax=Pararoseomonas baculiformis TaxID=2820812 RepID=A0ABS4AH47_9PROT|nr:PAS domain S-box protein [Pararoseomonas baculiformis]
MTTFSPDHAAAASARIAALEAEVLRLRGQAEQARRILESATEYAIFSLDFTGGITDWNTGARRILGYDAAEILGRSGEVFFTHEDREQGAFVAELCNALEEGRAINERWHVRKDGSRFWASGMMLPLLDREGRPQGFLNILRDGTDLHDRMQRKATLLAEMQHRVKNILTLAQSLAVQTQRYAKTPASFQADFTARLVALARSHDVLTANEWSGAPLDEILRRSLAPHGGPPSRVSLHGLPFRLPSTTAITLGLAFHELATNATKYGALSTPEGQLEVRWDLQRGLDGQRGLRIAWRERGGPPVTPPERQGFGSRLLEEGLAYQLGGTVRLRFAPEGLECEICFPLPQQAMPDLDRPRSSP